MKVFVGQVPWYKFIGGEVYYGVRAGSRWPHTESYRFVYMPYPFFMGYAVALLRKKGFDVEVCDGCAELLLKDEFLKRLVRARPDVVVLEVSTPTLDVDLEAAKLIKEALPGTRVVFCGPCWEIKDPEIAKKLGHVDYAVYGEYERPLLALLEAIREGGPRGPIPGVVEIRDGEVVTGGEPPVADVNRFPWPDRELFPIYNYIDPVCELPLPSLQMWSSRGCPYGCIYCLWPQLIFGRTFRQRDVEDVVEEMITVSDKYNFKSVYFDDDTFNIGKGRMLKFAELLKARDWNKPWAIMARADLMDEEILEKFREIGLWGVKYGIESASQAILDRSGKALKLEKALKTVEITKKLGIRVHLTFMFGLPGETEETIEKTIELAIQLDPYSVQFSIATPFPGTEFYRMAEREGWLVPGKNIYFDGAREAVISYPNLPKSALDEAVRRAYERWRSHKRKSLWEGLPSFKLSCDVGHRPRKVLALRSSYVEHARASLADFRRRFPEAEVTLVVQPGFEDAFKDFVNSVEVYSESRFFKANTGFWRRFQNFDAVLIMFSNGYGVGYSNITEVVEKLDVKFVVSYYTSRNLEIRTKEDFLKKQRILDRLPYGKTVKEIWAERGIDVESCRYRC